jgi:hypothetical protein
MRSSLQDEKGAARSGIGDLAVGRIALVLSVAGLLLAAGYVVVRFRRNRRSEHVGDGT